MSRQRVFVELTILGNVVRIFKNWRAASASPKYPEHVLEVPRSYAVESIRRQVFERSKNQCERCGNIITWGAMHMHEKVFKSKGGEVSIENCIALCYDCHEGAPESAHGNRRPQFSGR